MAERASAVATVLIDNERVIVTEWRFAPGAETGRHRHGRDYIVTPLTTGTLLIEAATGETRSALRAGCPYFRQAGVEHNVVNDNPFEFVFVETELK